MAGRIAAVFVLAFILIWASHPGLNRMEAYADEIVVPDQYSTIQAAINHANDGDTISVRAGVYYEHVVVNKTVALVGENKETAVIDGNRSGTVITLTADNVRFSGFTVQHGEVGLDLRGSNSIVSSNIFSFNTRQEIDSRSGLEVYSDPVSPVWRYLYDLMNGSYTEVFELTGETPVLGVNVSGYSDAAQVMIGVFCDSNMDGTPQLDEFAGFGSRDHQPLINLVDPPAGRYILKVQGYDVAGNPGHFDRQLIRYEGCGMTAHNSRDSVITGNLMADNQAGLYIQSCTNLSISSNEVTRNLGGIVAGEVTGGRITGNNVSLNGRGEDYTYGISLRACTGADISYNHLEANTFGITLWNSSGINVEGNELTSHYGWGIELQLSSYNSVTGNNCSVVNNLDGVRLMFSSCNRVEGNRLSYCEHSGILFWYDCYNNTVVSNMVDSSGSEGWGHGHGAELLFSYNNLFSKNQFTHERNQGIVVIEANDNNFTENVVAQNSRGIMIRLSAGNRVYHNSITDNTEFQGYDENGGNLWDNGYSSGGNYWGGQSRTDDYYGPLQDKVGSDGICDQPYFPDVNGRDSYPLMSPYEYWSNPILGDVNKDMIVNMGDIVQLCDGFGSVNGSEGYYWHNPPCVLCPHSPNLDTNATGQVDMGDIVAALDHFGKHYS